MKNLKPLIVEESTSIKLVIKNIDGLDPISVFIEDLEPAKGKITITIYGKAWVSFWGGMGVNKLAEFFSKCDNAYLTDRLDPELESNIIDYPKISQMTNCDVEEKTVMFYMDEIEECFGSNCWFSDVLPKTTNPKWKYLDRVVSAVKVGLNSYLDKLKRQEKFKREKRYIVFKESDVREYFTVGVMAKLKAFEDQIYTQREIHGRPPFKCVCVESDWPEYEMVWESIEKRESL